jgi:hypothetical protein
VKILLLWPTEEGKGMANGQDCVSGSRGWRRKKECKKEEEFPKTNDPHMRDNV